MSTEISRSRLERSEVVGKGLNSEVYSWGNDRVLKLFHRGIPAAKPQHEFTATRAIHALGLPVPAAHDLVQVEGRHGIVFERIEGISLLTHAQRKPWKLFTGARQLAELHARIHRCVAPAGLPRQRDHIEGKIRAARDSTEGEKQRALGHLEELPDGNALCHGDFHPENIILTARGPVVIDWEGATRGHPAGDVACTCRLMQHADLPPWAPRYMHVLLACSRRLLLSTYLRRYAQFHAAARQQIKAWEFPLLVAASAWRGRYSGD